MRETRGDFPVQFFRVELGRRSKTGGSVRYKRAKPILKPPPVPTTNKSFQDPVTTSSTPPQTPTMSSSGLFLFAVVVVLSPATSFPLQRLSLPGAANYRTALDAIERPTCTVTKNSAYYLSLPVDDLYHSATGGRRVGGCYIQVSPNGGYCDLYVKSATVGNHGHRGWPRSTSNVGTGCVKAPDFPKRRSHCFFSSSQYSLSATDRASFCTNNGKSNAVAQLKHAIRHGQCAIASSPAPVSCVPGSAGCGCTHSEAEVQAMYQAALKKAGYISQAGAGNWQCAHSPGKGSCFLKSAEYAFKVVGKCAPCIKALFDDNGSSSSSGSGSGPFANSTSAAKAVSVCVKCGQAAKDAPKCGGTIFGINSGHKGRSCQLINGNGCWPLKSASVEHDCGPGAECRFKVSDAKAKIWCCSPKKGGWLGWIHNALRCSSRATSSSKDKDGAQVVWE